MGFGRATYSPSVVPAHVYSASGGGSARDSGGRRSVGCALTNCTNLEQKITDAVQDLTDCIDLFPGTFGDMTAYTECISDAQRRYERLIQRYYRCCT